MRHTSLAVAGHRAWTVFLWLGATVASAACGASPSTPTSSIPRKLLLEARPIGAGPRFHPPPSGPVLGPCRAQLGPRFGVHLEVFAANRVVLVPGGIGTAPPRSWAAGRLSRARCYGSLVTVDPTGVVLIRPGLHLTVADLFRSWGEPLTASRVASFTTDRAVIAFVDGRPWRRAPGSVPLTRHAEIVVEVGPRVPPHTSYTFPRGD